VEQFDGGNVTTEDTEKHRDAQRKSEKRDSEVETSTLSDFF
jgi:hypothetical protein